MKVREDETGYELEVYGIYWINGKRYHYVFSAPLNYGLIVLNQDKCTLIDVSIDNFEIRCSGDGGDILIHKAASKDNLLDDVVEHMPEAVAEFKRRLVEYE